MAVKRDIKERFWEKVNKTDGCWEWTGQMDGCGYGFFRVKKMERAHRAVFMLDGLEIPPGICVLHKCNNRKCVNPAHLKLGSHAENMRHKSKSGNAVQGEGHPSAKLIEKDIPRIRDLLACGASNMQIASWFDVSHSTIRSIKRGKTWRHVSGC